MKTDEPELRWHVRYSDGGTFGSSASSASEYLLAPAFLHFFLTSVVLYAAIVQRGTPVDLEPLANVIFWSSIFLTSLLLLVFTVGINMKLVEMGILKSIHTYFVLVPIIVVNTVLIDYMLMQFGTIYERDLDSIIWLSVRHIVIYACFDILHGRYVAPQHPSYIPTCKTAIAKAQRHNFLGPSQDISEPNEHPLQIKSDSGQDFENTERDAEAQNLVAEQINQKIITLGNNNFDISEIEWIRSEDHYLRIQIQGKSKLVREKLRNAVAIIDETYGVQINRSLWVAFSTILSTTQTEGGHLEVELKDRSIHRVAKARELMVVYKLEAFKEWPVAPRKTDETHGQ